MEFVHDEMSWLSDDEIRKINYLYFNTEKITEDVNNTVYWETFTAI